MMTKEDKVRAIRFLNEHGALLITKSGDKIAPILAFPSTRYIHI